MLNLVSLVIGVVAMLVAVPAFMPLLGWLNWLVVPLAMMGLAIGAMSGERSGRNLNIVVVLIGIARLMLGGGFL